MLTSLGFTKEFCNSKGTGYKKKKKNNAASYVIIKWMVLAAHTEQWQEKPCDLEKAQQMQYLLINDKV